MSPATAESPLSPPAAVECPLNTATAVVHQEVIGNGKQKAIYPSEELKRVESERERADEGGLTGCREAVEILTRNPKKGSSFLTFWSDAFGILIISFVSVIRC